MKIAIVAPGVRFDPSLAETIQDFVKTTYGDRVTLAFQPECFMSHGHFAGSDTMRKQSFVRVANDPEIDAVWFGRGGYGAVRLAIDVVAELNREARKKIYMGYSDAGYLLAMLYKARIGRCFHGPMPVDFGRADGGQAFARGFEFLVEGVRDGLEPSVDGQAPTIAFNMTVLSQMIGTPMQPNLAGHVVMLEEVSEYMYRIDRTMAHLTLSEAFKGVAGVRLGRCSDVPENDVPFGLNEEEIAQYWCARAHIPYLGRADIGHDVQNKIVPFGRFN